MCGALGDGSVRHFYFCYRKLAEELGVLLADESDPGKAFNASPMGVVLGVEYDLDRWQWWLPENKLVPLVLKLAAIRDSDSVKNSVMLSVNGKLNHYMWLVPGGPWQRGFLLSLQDAGASGSVEFKVNDLARRQAGWWVDHLRAARVKSTIPDLRPMSSLLAVPVFADAAGGSEGKIRNGVGGFCPPHHWFYVPWPRVIRENRQNSLSVRLAHKLSCLEAFGSLVGLTIVPDIARNAEIKLVNDNSGFVDAFRKKHSSCPYLYTVIKAINDVAEGLGCTVSVVKTPRCSGVGEEVADALSKGDWNRAWPLMPWKNEDPGHVPRSLLRWIGNPIPDLDLGIKVISEMATYTNVLHLP